MMNRTPLQLIYFSIALCFLTFASCKKEEVPIYLTQNLLDAEDSLVVSRFEKLNELVFFCGDSAHFFKGPIQAKRILLQYNQPEISIQGDPDFTGAKPYISSSALIIYYDSIQDVGLWIEVSIFEDRSGKRLSSMCKYYLKYDYAKHGAHPSNGILLYRYYYNYKGETAWTPKNTNGLPHGYAWNYMSELNIGNNFIGQRTFKNCYADSQYLRFPEKNIVVLDSNAFPIYSYQRETTFMHPDGRYEPISNFLYERLK